MAGTTLIVARRNFHDCPQFCASCLSTNDLERRIIKAPWSFTGTQFETSIPICSGCRRRLRWLHPFGTAVLLIALLWLNYKLDHLHVARPIAFLFVLLPIVHTYAVQALKGPVRVRARRGNELEFWFANQEYARLFELENPCVAANSELGRVL